MNILPQSPPNYDAIKAALNLDGKRPVFTYGDTIYAPHGPNLPDHVVAHEEVHQRQQTNPKEWWDKYLADPAFRSEQELEAYRVQYQYVRKHIRDRNAQARLLWYFAEDLSSPMYGDVMSFDEAMNAIAS